MLSKCANPECSAKFLYLYEGKIFVVKPARDLEHISYHDWGLLEERFWLCDECCKRMTILWAGTQPEVVPLRRENWLLELSRYDDDLICEVTASLKENHGTAMRPVFTGASRPRFRRH